MKGQRAGAEACNSMSMKHLRTTAVLLTLLRWVVQACAQSGKDCLSYEPTVVKLTGVLISRTYPGPPEYASIRKGDEPETYWLLALPRPACVDPSDPTDPIKNAKRGIRRIQLVFNDDKDYRTYRRLLGRPVTATGTLYGSFTIHHKTPVLLNVTTLEAKHP
jgi:hypothetical protein